MLQKFIAIKNIGNFKSHAATGDTDLRRFTLVHAENARGKTTLCSVMRSLRGADANLILERKTLDSIDPPYVKILLDSGVAEFKDGSWSAPCPQLEIFDAEFVTENVYSGDAITHDHKKNLCRIVLGQEGVQLAHALDEIDAEERTASATLNTAKADVATLSPKGVSVEAFIALPQDAAVDAKIEEKKREISVADAAEEIRLRASLTPLHVPMLPPSFEAMLGRTIEGVSADAANKVHEHIEKNLSYMRGPENWLSVGVNFDDNGICPLCAQPLNTSPVFTAMKDFFSREYREFQRHLEESAKTARQAVSSEALISVQRTVAGNAALIEFWQAYMRGIPPEISFDSEIQPVIENLRAAIEPLIEQKLTAPLEAVDVTEEYRLAVAAFEKLRIKVGSYNERVDSMNGSIAAVKNDAVTSNALELKSALMMLEAQKKRHTPESQTVITAYNDARTVKSGLEKTKEEAREKLDAYNDKVIGAYHDAVNELLSRFGAGFKLLTVKVEYTGRTPRAAYTFGIRGKSVDPGGDRTPPGTPCFRNTLSAGDRSTLALAFFVAQLKHRADIGDAIVVFDDPFTSLDSFRQHWTCCTIRKMATRAKQVIVLSHSLEFLRMVADRCDATNLRTLQIARHNAVDSHIIGLDLRDAAASVVEKDIIQLRDFKAGEEADELATVRCIRPVLENHIRTMAPDDCPTGNGWLGPFLGEINKADSASRLAIFKPMYDDLDSLNSYTSPYAHDSGAALPINRGELAAQVDLTLELVGRA